MTSTSVSVTPLFLAGEWVADGVPLEVTAPGSDEVVGATFEATEDQLERATVAAVEAFSETRRSSSYERGEILRRAAEILLAEQSDIARLLAHEIGKPLADARLEVTRTALVYRTAAEEAERIGGEVLPLDQLSSSRGRWGVTRRVPLGPVAAIAPFNVPLSLASHKVAPALAAGNTVVLKPDSRVALTSLRLADVLERAGVRHGALSVLPMSVEVADRLVTDDRFRALTFTGSAAVGWQLRSRAGRKKVVLELGGNCPVVVDETADVERAAERTVRAAFKYAGQLCISVQRAFVHHTMIDRFTTAVVEGAEKLRVGEPLDDGVDVGPMIDEASAERVEALIAEAVDEGARCLTGGHRDGAYVTPTVLEGDPGRARVWTDEAFGPVLAVAPFERFEDGIGLADDSPYGLQAGVFTSDLQRALAAFDRLDVGAVVIGDVPTFRVDNMPFGGTKGSGIGREGVRYAIEDLTEPRMLVLENDTR